MGFHILNSSEDYMLFERYLSIYVKVYVLVYELTIEFSVHVNVGKKTGGLLSNIGSESID
ncbi:MAG: hypothetical protein CMJ79_13070 [Planctomycetaceae bacterium]|nr:hypothetical protein [Planctomycetaceae bacterium]